MINQTQTASDTVTIAQRTPVSILFLCTGNFYRSRFAEELFNDLAISNLLPCWSTSLGFTPHPETNLGPISSFTLQALKARGIQPRNATRLPAAVSQQDFLRHDRCIALSESEHRSMMQREFPEFLSNVRFWQVEDLAWEKPEIAMGKIEVEVHKLLGEFRRPQSTP